MTNQNSNSYKVDLPRSALGPLASTYQALLELAERDIRNVPACQVILFGLSELDIRLGETRQATGPYIELGEYFLYLLDVQEKLDPELQKYNQEQLMRFRSRVMDRSYSAG